MYAAPEQIVGTRTGPWTDVHAMGLILTEVLTDRAAYRIGTPQMLMAQALAPIRPSPGAMGFDVGEWEAVIQRALAIAPRDRFANAHEFLAALESSMARASVPGNRAPIDTSAEQTHWMGSSAPNSDTRVTGEPRISNPPASLQPTKKPESNASDTTRSRQPKPNLALRATLIAFAAFGSATATWIAFRQPPVGTAITDAAAALAPARLSRNATPAPPSTAPAPASVQRPDPPAAPTPAAAPATEPPAALPPPALPTPAPANPPAAHSHHGSHARSGSTRRSAPGGQAQVPLE